MRLDGQAIGCRSDVELGEIVALTVIGGPGGGCTLRASRVDDAEKKRALITAVRGGEHVELKLTARTFRQKLGKPNRRFLRFTPEALANVAKTSTGMPFLLDHNTWEQKARIGTILSAELVEQGDGWTVLKQELEVVKPDAVISVLDGTLDQFSIGWIPTGPVLCSVHRTDVRSWDKRCCWPGDKLEVDGAPTTVEWEFQSAEHIETSGVNVPAVKGTKIEDIRTALAAEVGGVLVPHHQEPAMSLLRLAAAMGLSTLAASADEDRAIAIFQGLTRDKLAAEQERDAARTSGTTLTAIRTALQLDATTPDAKVIERVVALLKSETDAKTSQVDGLIAELYRGGKLRWGRDGEGKAVASGKEVRLRRIAQQDGLDALRAEIAEMEVVVPVGERTLTATPNVDPIPRVDTGLGATPDALANVARQLGLDPAELQQHAQLIGQGRSGRH